MSSEPFVMSSVERAQEWVSAFSKSLLIGDEQSAALLASLCGFASWDVMVFGIQNIRPSTCDELVEQEEFVRRAEQYAAELMGTYGYTAELSRAIISLMSPSSIKEFKGFEPSDIEQILLEGDQFNIDYFFAAVGSDERIEVLSQLMGSVTSIDWLSALEYLGWRVMAVGDEEALLGEPSLEVLGAPGGQLVIPVYLAHSMPPPTFLTEMNCDEPSLRLIQCACLGNFVSEHQPHGATDFLILASRPMVKSSNGKWYCYVGVAYNSETRKWTDLLINSQCRDVETMLAKSRNVTSLHDAAAALCVSNNVTPIRKGASELAENEHEFAVQLARILSGFDPKHDSQEEWTVLGMPIGDGWTVLGATPEWDFYSDKVQPHVFDGTVKE